MAKETNARPLSIEGGDVVLPDRIIKGGTLILSGGKVASVGPAEKTLDELPAGCRRLRADGRWVCPSLWEVHIHGCGGVSVENMSRDSLRRMASFLAEKGVGAFLPTTVADEEILSALGEALASSGSEPGLAGRALGIYVEGPFVAPAKKGGIPERLIREPSTEYLQRLVDITRGTLTVMTFAPELPGASALFDEIASRRIVPSLGHSDARFSDLAPYDDVTPLGVTHLFNGMSGVSHKDPGLAQWALLAANAFVELNCDGTHVHDAAVKLALRVRPPQRTVLISDAFTPAGLDGDEGSGLRVYGREVVSRGGGVYYADTGVLVGSRLLVNEGVGRLVSRFDVPLPWAVSMASLNPARHLGFLQKGALLPGYDADVAVFSRDFSRCLFTVWQGKPVFEDAELATPRPPL